MSRRHSSSPNKSLNTRLHKLSALLDELAKAPHQTPDDDAALLPTKLLKRVLAFVGCGSGAAAACKKWRRAAAAPELWRDAVQRAAVRSDARATADNRARHQAKEVITALRAASRALGNTPRSRIEEIRDAMAAAARRQRRAPTDVERAVLEASCDVLDRDSATASHFRATLDGAALQPGERARSKLGAALAALDVPGLALSDDADAHRRLYELAVATACETFPAPARAAKSNVHLGRLAAWCVAAANCRDALLRARHTTPQPPRGPPPGQVVAAGERAVKRWLRLCAPGAPPEEAPPAFASPARFAAPRRRRRPAASMPPATPSSLRSIFDASKTHPVPRGADCAQTLHKFYAIHNPSLLPRAAQVAREWRGSEETLFALLRYKYGSGEKTTPLALALNAAETAKPRRRRSASTQPRRLSEGPRDRAEALRTLRAEVERLRASEGENAAKVEKEKRRANYASQRAKSLKEERDAAVAEVAEVTSLRRESAVLRENESHRSLELERLQQALDREREDAYRTDRAARAPVAPASEQCDVLDGPSVAVDAVLAALADVIIAECATEVEFELEFGLSEAQLLGLAPLPEALAPPPPKPPAARHPRRTARSSSLPPLLLAALDGDVDALNRELAAGTTPDAVHPPLARRENSLGAAPLLNCTAASRRQAADAVDATPAPMLRSWSTEKAPAVAAPSSGSSKASPSLRDLETTFRSLSSELSPSTAQGVMDGLASPLDELAR